MKKKFVGCKNFHSFHLFLSEKIKIGHGKALIELTFLQLFTDRGAVRRQMGF